MILSDFGATATNDELTKFQGIIDAALKSVAFTVNNPASTATGIQLAKRSAIETVSMALNAISAANKSMATQAFMGFMVAMSGLTPPAASAAGIVQTATTAANSTAGKVIGLGALAGVVGYIVWRRHKKG